MLSRLKEGKRGERAREKKPVRTTPAFRRRPTFFIRLQAHKSGWA
jgi:hypothetical protein